MESLYTTVIAVLSVVINLITVWNSFVRIKKNIKIRDERVPSILADVEKLHAQHTTMLRILILYMRYQCDQNSTFNERAILHLLEDEFNTSSQDQH